ncbi:methyltransferase family protein [Bacteroidota bacterium]
MEEINKKLKFQMITKFGLAPFVMGLFFFLPAGTFYYWQAWLYIGVICIPMLFAVFYFLKHDPELLRRRSQFNEKEKEQKILMKFMNIYFILVFLIPGFDFRYQWSNVPPELVIIANIFVFLSYMFVVSVLKENSYASRIIEVEKGQKVISAGSYAIVRHPMYSGVLLMLIFTPFALGSYWQLLAFSPVPILIALRLLNEEKVLKRDLEGYEEYCKKTKYRLIPFVW